MPLFHTLYNCQNLALSSTTRVSVPCGSLVLKPVLAVLAALLCCLPCTQTVAHGLCLSMPLFHVLVVSVPCDLLVLKSVLAVLATLRKAAPVSPPFQSPPVLDFSIFSPFSS